MPHLHLSIQAGDDLVLKRMKRRHLRQDAIDVCARARALRPGIAFGADLITGFPTETEAMFANTLALVEECGLAYLHVFPYSAREGTAAASFGGAVPVDERRRRVDELEAVARRSAEAVRRSFLGDVRPVLWETLERPANGAGPVWSGLTDNYLRIHAVAPAGLDLENRITAARLVAVDGQVLWADLGRQPVTRNT